MFVDQRGQVLAGHPAQHLGQEWHAADVLRLGSLFRPARHRELPTELRNLRFQRLLLVDQRFDPVHQIARLRLEHAGDLRHPASLAFEIGEGLLAGQRLDPAHAGRGRAVAEQHEQPDIAGPFHMGAAAELDRIGVAVSALAGRRLAHRHHPHLVAVFFAEQRLGAELAGLVDRQHPGLHRRVLADVGVDLQRDVLELLGRQRLVMAEIEPQPVGRVERAALRDVFAQLLAQRLVEQVGRRMVGADRAPAQVVDHQLGALPQLDPALHDLGHMQEDAGHLLGVRHLGLAGFGADEAGVADLAAGLGVERRLVDDDLHLGTGFGRIDPRAIAYQRPDLALGLLGVVAEKLGRALVLGDVVPDRRIRRLARARPGGTRLGLLFGHRGVEPRGLDRATLFAQRILGEVEREAVGVVELERGLARQLGRVRQRRQLLVEQPEPPLQRRLEPGLLGEQRFLDQHLRPAELGEGLAHLAHQFRHQPVHHRVLGARQVRMPHRPAHDPPEHVAAALVRRHHPVGDQERGRAQVVRDHPVVGLVRPVRVGMGRMRRGLDQRPHQIGVVIVVLALEQRADPLQPHAGVDRLHVEFAHRTVLELLVLHEDEVPDLDEAVAVLLRAARRAAPDVVAVVVEDLGRGTAGAGRTHLPEIVEGRDPDDLVVGQPRDLLPDRRRLVVGVVDGDQKLVLRDAEILRQQLPGIGDRLLLEVVAEGEVAEHLEKGVMARGIADIVEVVVLAAGADAFLRRGGALVVAVLDPGEQVLELNHAGVREHQRRVVARHQR